MDEAVVFIISDRYDADEVVDWTGEKPRCAVAELWAAIERYADARAVFELADRMGDNNQFAAALEAEQSAEAHLRELLGLEPEVES